jgi:ribosomal protein S18 acetylase RimI-like enzyme
MSGSSLDIRAFEDRDEEEVRRLWLQAFPDDPPRNEPASVIRRKLECQRELFLVGESDGVIVATLLAGYDGFRCWVYHVAVDETHRRKGYGRQMMCEAERMLRRMGCPKLNIQVRAHNQEVVEFYHRLDYDIDDHISMGKLLSSEHGAGPASNNER